MRKAYLGGKIVVFGMNVEGTDAGRTALGNIVGEDDWQDALVADLAVVQLIRMEAKREELPLVLRNLLEKVVEEGDVGPFAWPTAPQQPLVGEVVPGIQLCEAANGFRVGEDESGKNGQVRPLDEANVDANTMREGLEYARYLVCCPISSKGAERDVWFGIAGEITTNMLFSGHGDKLGKLGERAWVRVRHRGHPAVVG